MAQYCLLTHADPKTLWDLLSDTTLNLKNIFQENEM